jgi:hypothetical protein
MNSIFQKLSDKLLKSLSKQEDKKSDVPSSSTSTDKERVYRRYSSSTVEEVTGKRANSFSQFAKDYAEVFR